MFFSVNDRIEALKRIFRIEKGLILKDQTFCTINFWESNQA